ncbi:Na+/H+ antiporter NhaA [Nocardia farcinica]|uniref:Na+/H+ antiporter NhaA n=1 Tax=Nocardia farcinica TaxID=37329 RepID=UPI0037965A25
MAHRRPATTGPPSWERGRPARPGGSSRSSARRPTVGGFLLVAAAILALIVANTPLRSVYERVSDTVIGYAPWHLELSIAQWAADGLLAIFFFLVGLDLERHGGRTIAGVCTRIAQRVLALTAAIWHNDTIGAQTRRSLLAYDH